MAGRPGMRKKKTYTFEPGSGKDNDPDAVRSSVTDDEVASWASDLHKLAAAPGWTAWELDFIKQMSSKKTFTGKQVVLLKQYIGRLIHESASQISQAGSL